MTVDPNLDEQLRQILSFYPCGDLDENGKPKNRDLLLRLIDNSHYQANLSGANLSGADLSGANLSGTELSRANLSGANLKNMTWNDETTWDKVKGVETVINVSEELKMQLGT